MKAGLLTLAAFAVVSCNQTAPKIATQGAVIDPAPKQSHFIKKVECARLGEAQRERSQREARGSGTIMDSEQCYVPEIDSCIYAEAFLAKQYSSRSVVDLTTQRTLASYVATGDLAADRETFATYQGDKARLFAKCADAR